MQRITFEDEVPVAPSAPDRMDVALFVGFVRARPALALPDAVARWLLERGYAGPPYGSAVDALAAGGLLDVPIPVESFAAFERLFDWQARTPGADDGATYLGAAVRSFFAQGGRRCYVVRAGDPFGLEARRADRLAALPRLVPGYPFRLDPSPADRGSWRGAGHLLGLPDVSFLCLPDLADAVAADRTRVPVPPPPPPPPQAFAECAAPAPPVPEDLTVRGIGEPRCDEEGLGRWMGAIELLAAALRRWARAAQLVAALPILDAPLALDPDARSAFVQLAYPWVRTPGSDALPGGVESPEGVLAGVLARNALLRGTFRSAAGQPVGDVSDVLPELDRHAEEGLAATVSLVGRTPAGLRLVSDVTTSADTSYRPGAPSRLVAALVRAARRIGEDSAFEASGERLWGDVRARLEAFLRALFDAGAFRGASPAEAYEVRCDRSTMTQLDLDDGRVVAVVRFDPAAPVESLTVALILNDTGDAPRVESEAA